MKKEDLLSDDFLKQFKTGEDLYGFLAQLQKRGLEKMLFQMPGTVTITKRLKPHLEKQKFKFQEIVTRHSIPLLYLKDRICSTV